MILKLHEYISKVKSIGRTGWIEAGIEEPETIAEHMYSASLIAYMISRYFKLDSDKTLKVIILSLIHDLPEAVVGDIPTPRKKQSDLEREFRVLANIFDIVGLPDDWISELKRLDTLEAKIVKLADYISTLLQGINYWLSGVRNERIKEIISNYIDWSTGILNDPMLSNIRSIIIPIINKAIELLKS